MSQSGQASGTGRIYVDDAVIPHRGHKFAHMFSLDIAALHAMAVRLGVRAWFQDPLTMPVSWPHYDITAAMRETAVRLGAIPLDRYQAVAMATYIRGEAQTQTDFAPMQEALVWLRREVELVTHNGRFAGLLSMDFSGL